MFPPPQPLPHRWQHTLPFQLLCLAWLLTLLRPTLLNGDAAVYLSQLLDRELGIRTIHVGYLAFALPFVELPVLDPALRLHLVSVFWALVSLACLWRLEARLSPTPVRVPFSALWLFSALPMLRHSTTSEVYAMQLGLQLMALVMWLEHRALVAGLGWLAALAVSPSSVTLLPLLWLRRASPIQRLRMMVPPVLGMGALVAVHRQDYLYGSRGILALLPGMTPDQAAVYRLNNIPQELGWALLALAPGLLLRPFGGRLLPLIGAQILLTLAIDRYRDVPLHLLTLAMLSLVAALGIRHLLQQPGWRSHWPLVPLVLQLFLTDQAIRHERRQERTFATTCLSLSKSLARDERLAAPFSDRMRYDWYTTQRAPSGKSVDLAWALKRRWGHFRLMTVPKEPLPAGSQLEPHPGGGWTWTAPSPAPPTTRPPSVKIAPTPTQ